MVISKHYVLVLNILCFNRPTDLVDLNVDILGLGYSVSKNDFSFRPIKQNKQLPNPIHIGLEYIFKS